MKLIITQLEIEAIVRAHVLNTVQLREGADVKIDFTVTRGEDGITATIDIPYMGVSGLPVVDAPVAPSTEVAKPTRARKETPAPTAPAQEAPVQEATQPAADAAPFPEVTETPVDPSPVVDEAAAAPAATATLFGNLGS